jgi:hypothetical protein
MDRGMSKHSRLGALLLGAALAGCGAAAPKVEGPAAELVGAWISDGLQERRGDECPWIVEVFADGSLETNQLSDDRGNRCAFSRVPYEIDAESDPPVLQVGGQMSRCLFQRDGARLKLVCEDHGTPSDVQPEDWFVFEPFEVERETTIEGLVGTWSAGTFWGSPLVATVDERGAMTPCVEEGEQVGPDDTTTLEIVTEDRIVARREDRVEHCLFRATRHRLTLRCQPADSGWPTAIFDPSGDPEDQNLLVFYRISRKIECGD